MPASPSFARSITSRLAPLRGNGAAVVVALCISLALATTVDEVLVDVRDGRFFAWFLNTAGVLGRLGAEALLASAIVVPVLRSGLVGWRRLAALVAAVVAAAFAVSLLQIAIVRVQEADLMAETWPALLKRFWIRWAVRHGTTIAMLVAVAEFYRREVRSVEAMNRAELDRAALDREMAATRLQVLQAQIEPHFLFNTLANVRRLYETDSGTGRRMLDNLMRYLEVALPRMRDRASTLGREHELLAAFLDVQQIRMGHRLAFAVEIPAELRDVEVPPMMLLTLVENALKHGLTPLPEGGFVRVSAARAGDELLLSVADTGRGFGEGTSGGGTGLANIRVRLQAMHGDRADLTLAKNTPRGVTATIRLPWPTSERRDARAGAALAPGPA